MKNIFLLPVFADEKKSQTAHLLYVLLWTFILAVSVTILIAIVLPEITMRELLLIGTVDASSVLLLILTQRGHTRLVSWLVVLQVWVITTALASTGGGIHNPAVALYLIVVLIAGLTLGQRVGLIIAGFCLLTELILVYAEQADVLLPSVINHNALTIWVSNTWAMIIIVSLQYFAASTVSGSFDRVYKALGKRQRAEEELSKSEEKYRLSFENISDVIITIDSDFRISNVSPSVETILRYKPETFIDQPISDLRNIFTPESFQRALSEGAKILAGEKVHRSNFDLIAEDGTLKTLELRASPLRKDGKSIGLIVAGRDTTERKWAEKALRDQAEQYSAILSTTPDGFWLVDDKGRLLDVNENYCRMSGYSREELLQLTVPDLESAEKAKDTEYHIHKIIQNGSDRFETQHRTKDGWIFNVEVSTTFLASKGLIVFIRDITRRKKAEEALRTSEEKYREILDNIDDGYYEVNLAGRFTFFNDVLPRFLDYTHEELLHTNFKTVMDEENAKKVFEAFHVVYLTGVPDRLVEWESTKKDGSKVYVESSVFPVKDAEGKSVGFRGVVRDISERKKFQEKLHAMATTDELTGLCNRRGFITLAEQQLKYAERNKKKSMLAFVDLDGMKQINDIWGHEEGDRALINTANLLKQVFRKSDIIARLGGDEFAVLAADVSETMPDVFLRRLQKLLDTHNSMKDQRYRLSMSVGSTFYEPDNPTSLDEIMSLADKLMYEDKRRKVV
ncbi:MAG: PAS domain S-box protein [Syntrophales bacterium]|jgi:diguanylate cyclase (GGDEF)-like protein/PAS domain S-box-containing protein